MRQVAERAVVGKQLYDPGFPGPFIAWADRMGFSVPKVLKEKVQAYGHFIGDWTTLHDDLKAKYDTLAIKLATSTAKATALNGLQEKSSKQYRELSEQSSALIARGIAKLAERDATIKELEGEVEDLKRKLAAAPPEKPLGQREGDTLRKLVIGLAMVAYAYDPKTARSEVAAEIVSDLNQRGLAISDDTVRKHLKEAAQLLPPVDAPERRNHAEPVEVEGRCLAGSD
jgi:hypothetical protein